MLHKSMQGTHRVRGPRQSSSPTLEPILFWKDFFTDNATDCHTARQRNSKLIRLGTRGSV